MRPVKKKYKTLEILELNEALSSNIPSSRCFEKGSRSSVPFRSSLEIARVILALILSSRLMRNSLAGSSPFSVS